VENEFRSIAGEYADRGQAFDPAEGPDSDRALNK
jgi:hypothetical protein